MPNSAPSSPPHLDVDSRADDVFAQARAILGDGLRPEVPLTGLGGRVLIGELISKGVEPPTQLIEDFLYEGRVHAVVSEAGTGKTLLALWAALEVMKEGGSVLYLDEENGGRLIGERLLNMGADLEMLDRSFFYHHSPGITLKANALAELRVTAEAVRPALVVFDSLPDFLALAGLNENEAADVTRWFLEVARPLRDAGSAVLLLDHVVKSAEGRGRYA
ncbi:MAG: hypothetical protein CYG60_19610, partial [Actinobacteria bacterium]